ncbi:MAG: hypothetical protein JSV51_00155 [Candidatus Bathyarchaeota archaeon]|nr:MAG: hypothetical protein JSV51_00155 [Candidatus Bathyarchaeota archaeon]
MTEQSRKRLIFYWTAPRNLLAVLLFIMLSLIMQYFITVMAIPSSQKDLTMISLPLLNTAISPVYHLLPVAVIITLTTSFTHLASQIATMPRKTQMSKKPLQRRAHKKLARPTLFQKFQKRFQKSLRRAKSRILKTPTITSLRQRITLARAILKSAIVTTATFIIITLLVTIAAYPKLVPTITSDFYQWNTIFLNFVTGTIRASETVAKTLTPIGVIATGIHNALIAAAPTFHNTLKAAASAITNGLVALNPTAKYLMIQNLAAWVVASITLIYGQYTKYRR